MIFEETSAAPDGVRIVERVLESMIAMPTVLRIGGHRFFFFSKEGNEPPHIHIESAENHAKFWLEPVELEECVGYHASESTRLRRLVEAHRALFLEKWHEHFTQT